MEKIESRFFKFDNLKCFLIFLVVFGHLLRCFELSLFTKLIYQGIFSFHMPLFIFITGYFSKKKSYKEIFSYFKLYLLFQTMYLLFQIFFVDGNEKTRFSYTTPFWIMWYIFLLPIYLLVLRFIDTKNNYLAVLEIFISFCLSVLVGFFQCIGDFCAISRFFYFLPFYLIGYYIKRINIKRIDKFLEKRIRYIVLSITFLLAIAGCFWISNLNVKNSVLFGNKSYVDTKSSFGIRIMLMLIALVWIFLLCSLSPKGKLPFITEIGKNTLSIYLLHGFIVKTFDKYQFFRYSEGTNLLWAFILSIIIIFAFGNKYVNGVILLIKGKYKCQ